MGIPTRQAATQYSGDITTTAGGVVTVADDAVDGTDIEVGGAAEAAGDVLYSNGTDVVRLGIGATGQVLHTNEGATAPEWRSVAGSSVYCHIFEDFLGAFTALDTANRATDGSLGGSLGPWETDQTETTGDGVIHALTDDVDGHFKLGFSANSEIQCGTLYWGDVLNISADKDPIIIFRLKCVAGAGGVLDSTTEVAWGLCSAQNDDANACTYVHSFSIDGANADLLINSDDNATPDLDNDSGVNFTDNTFWEFKIDLANPADVQYSYRATLGGAWTALLPATVFVAAAAAEFQPFVQITKEADTNVDSVIIDYIEVMWNRT
jgi:hypothetical protein